jgi:GTPase-associated adaptor domain
MTPTIVQETSINDVEAVMGEQSTRKLVLRFWQLPMDARRKIALKLELIDETEIALPEPERYGRALGRAGERGLLQKLAEEVEKWTNR